MHYYRLQSCIRKTMLALLFRAIRQQKQFLALQARSQCTIGPKHRCKCHWVFIQQRFQQMLYSLTQNRYFENCLLNFFWPHFATFLAVYVCSTSLLYYDNECMSQFLLNLILQPLVIRSYPAFISIIREPVKKVKRVTLQNTQYKTKNIQLSLVFCYQNCFNLL